MGNTRCGSRTELGRECGGGRIGIFCAHHNRPPQKKNDFLQLHINVSRNFTGIFNLPPILAANR